MAFGSYRDHPLLAQFRARADAAGLPVLTGGTPFDDSGSFDDTGGERLPSNPPPTPGPVGQPNSRLNPLLAFYKAYARDPGLLESGSGAPFGGAQRSAGDLFTTTTHGARAGQQHATFDLPGGQKANVYYDPKTGKRRVFRY